jgi:uncharacterized SAM-binding protein YcdF (DUF218 family)
MRILSILAFVIIVVLLISRYLGPDDLSKCSVGPSTEKGCQAADVIVAVSGGDTTARTVEAIKLYQAGWAPRLVFSGAAFDKNSPSNAAVMRGIALASGVPEEAISIDEYGRTTKQNAEETANLLESEGISSMILVTSGYHQRRTSLEFQKRFETVAIRNHPVSQDSQWSMWWWMTPVGWYLALGEVARIILFYVGVTR